MSVRWNDDDDDNDGDKVSGTAAGVDPKYVTLICRHMLKFSRSHNVNICATMFVYTLLAPQHTKLHPLTAPAANTQCQQVAQNSTKIFSINYHTNRN